MLRFHYSSIAMKDLTQEGYEGQEGLSGARDMTSRGRGVSGAWRYGGGGKGKEGIILLSTES